MKYLDEFRDQTLAEPLLKELRRSVTKPFRVMEVCGTHTMSIFRSGLRTLLPEEIELISGPGCPVCVTSASHIDAILAMAELQNTRIALFGDLFRVPGSNGLSLANASSQGAKVDIVYSPMDSLNLARKYPEELIVFLGVGFETTTPGIAATILAAKNSALDNFAVFSTHKTMPPPLLALLDDPELQIDGLLCPGHVSSIIGAGAYQPLADTYKLACVVGGFEPADILQALILMARQIANGEARVENAYTRAVRWEENSRAQQMVRAIFKTADMEWRGLGVIPESGLAIREEYSHYDAERRLNIKLTPATEPKGCRCGEILKGKEVPSQCPLYGKRCTPGNPVGPCMVSSEGTCAAFFKYTQ
ncbi:hydrogenase expression/formation protein HypD [Desulfocapsa sulfexigens DSM 10523]|uniref:Hydrogenase expression/formation protein HypD n=1 Tax=Desulfocapsa sulfexigens (strain DSM 10523 / SB164P1) TaxID=1167006 RepID=M1ND90_DESSD|nr:hydrogenase formation protein HypD [Desulfocapsa sulfexigens]AGF77729.1 hydrogenase expression/formation protein HypD [Desulfocapsa sulfexigens DSM 10523]